MQACMDKSAKSAGAALSNVTLRQLRYFDALAQSLHFGRAAVACAVTQPALSMQIQELEREIGTPLIERTRQGARLTDEGREIAGRVGRILSEVRDLVDRARHNRRLLSGALRLGVIPTIAPYLLPPLLLHLRADYPELELHLRESQTQHLVSELIAGKLDLVLMALPAEHADLDQATLFTDRFLLALPRARRLPAKVLATPDLMRRDRLLLLEEGHCLRDQALDVCNLRQVQNIDTYGASSLSTIVQMVAGGYGITLLPEISIALESRSEPLRLVRFAEPQPYRTIGLAWRRSSPRKRDFIALGKLIAAIHAKSSG
jgi:LysR family transcriptional regulator, hydrogen peroxide-inducible genes activator